MEPNIFDHLDKEYEPLLKLARKMSKLGLRHEHPFIKAETIVPKSNKELLYWGKFYSNGPLNDAYVKAISDYDRLEEILRKKY